jgi:hypothetical protein
MNFFEFKKRLMFLYGDLALRIFVMFTGTMCLITDIGNYPVVSLFINISTFTYYKTLLGVYPVFYMGVLFSNTEDYNVNTALTTAPADELSLILFTAEDFRYIVKLKTIEASSSISFYINLYSHMSAKLNYEYATTLSKINYQIQHISLIADTKSLETLTISYLKYMLQNESFLNITTAALVKLTGINLHTSHTFSLGLTESILSAFSLEIKGSHDYTTDITVYPTDSYYVKLNGVSYSSLTLQDLSVYLVDLSVTIAYNYSVDILLATNKYLNDYEFKYISAIEDNTLIKETYKEV